MTLTQALFTAMHFGDHSHEDANSFVSSQSKRFQEEQQRTSSTSDSNRQCIPQTNSNSELKRMFFQTCIFIVSLFFSNLMLHNCSKTIKLNTSSQVWLLVDY